MSQDLPRPMPSIHLATGRTRSCKAPMGHCGAPVRYVVRWAAGRNGRGLARRELCETHGVAWAKRRHLPLPADE